MTVTSSDINVPLQVLFDRTAYLRARVWSFIFDASQAPYSAPVGGAADARPGIQAAIDAAAAAGGGAVYLPPGVFRIDAGLNLPNNVSLFGSPDGTVLTLNHATANLITFTAAPGAGVASLIQDIAFEGSVVNIGTVLIDAVATRRIIRNCAFNAASSNLRGRVARLTFAASDARFENGRIKVAGNVDGVSGVGDIWITGGRLVMPGGYNQNLIYADGRRWISGVYIDTTASTGSGVVISTAPNIPVTVCENVFDDGGGTGARAYALAAGTELNAWGNDYKAIALYAGGPLKNTCRFELLPWSWVSLPAGPSALTLTGGVKTEVIRSLGTAPTLTMPTPLFLGQEKDLILLNKSGAAWAGVTVIGLLFGGTNAIGNNEGRSIKAIAVDRFNSGTLEWVALGDWSTAFL